jgi:hypothetical protein|tara:strand:+ start:400 stop:822 length:423 start_codon:yes stop_codon:yes gene_type:complete
MNIQHAPLFNTAEVEKIYSEKDGIPVKYVCTSATYGTAEFAADVFYRETPHPEFGNHYFGLYRNPYANNATVMIANADPIESFEFGMIEDDGKYYYSQHRHDYKEVGDKMIDGGRAYIRSGAHDVQVLKIKDGEFVDNVG